MYDTVRSFATLEQQSMYENILKGMLSDEKTLTATLVIVTFLSIVVTFSPTTTSSDTVVTFNHGVNG
ncbi:hypothetical protein J2Z22_000850 [Paenibacillus forsythiae]|uniref:Uncharacterized protein n=1 Tax=Paenibacillus forsythiae TaxID=365616 RepID=A0ABU3H3E2_9BACL|nr:hypothetical protein [Paenibacillus forsythiae]